MDDLDQWLARVPPGGPSLNQLEADVWGRVRAMRAERATARVRVVAVIFALSVGVANGGLGASLARPPASEMSVFSSAALLPLARLEVH
ncbi:MAG: hypothetical protein J0M36_10700 [Caulobacterales bacterium]|nr:hypothetical protein [Caulobacterales bacterium]